MNKAMVMAMLGVLVLAAFSFAQYPEVSIRDIQEVPVGEDSSHYEGDTVHVGGIVTAGTGLYYAGDGVTFYMEMAEGGPFSGVMAYNPSPDNFPTLIPGDSITVDALVSEYGYSPSYDPPWTCNMTELFIVPGTWDFHSFGNPEPEPIVVTADLIDSTGGADSLAEQFEGCYIRVYDVTVDSLVVYSSSATWVCHDSTGHQFMVREASDSIAYLPTVGTQFEYVNGVVYHRFDNYNLQPRYMRDIAFPSGAPIIGNIEWYPDHPFENDAVNISANVFDPDGEVNIVRLYYRLNLGSWINVRMSEGSDNDFFYNIPPLPAGTRIDFYIWADDDEGNERTEPSEAPWNFKTYVILNPREMTIAEAIVDADENFIPDMLDSAAILTGIATSYNFGSGRTDFFMQMDDAGIDVILFSDEATISIGDSVQATGVIAQYYGKNQLEVSEVDRITNFGEAEGIVDPVSVTCAQLNEGNGELYEGRVVVLSPCIITADPDPWPAGGESATMTINDGTGDLMMRIDYGTDIPGQPMPTVPQQITGCLGQYSYNNPPNDDYQLMPRMYADFQDAGDVDDEVALPVQTALSQNYPNPFNPSTAIMFSLAEQCDVELSIYDVLGRKVYEVYQSDVAVGNHSITWHGEDSFGNSVASGVYFYRIEAGDFVDSKQMMLLK